MVKPKKPTQKTFESPSEIVDNPPTELTNGSSPGSDSPEHAQRDAPEEDDSSSPILGAIRRMENSMNARFDNLETTLAGVKNAVTSNTSHSCNKSI